MPGSVILRDRMAGDEMSRPHRQNRRIFDRAAIEGSRTPIAERTADDG
jgi:hypothetical protein